MTIVSKSTAQQWTLEKQSQITACHAYLRHGVLIYSVLETRPAYLHYG